MSPCRGSACQAPIGECVIEPMCIAVCALDPTRPMAGVPSPVHISIWIPNCARLFFQALYEKQQSLSIYLVYTLCIGEQLEKQQCGPLSCVFDFGAERNICQRGCRCDCMATQGSSYWHN